MAKRSASEALNIPWISPKVEMSVRPKVESGGPNISARCPAISRIYSPKNRNKARYMPVIKDFLP
jgi:hypothetical protein